MLSYRPAERPGDKHICREALNRLPTAKKKIRLMKRSVFAALAALGIIAGCHKTEPQKDIPEVDDTEKVAVQLGISAPGIDIVSKGSGPVDAWDSQNLYIIGAKKNTAYDSDGAFLIDNIAITAPSSGIEDFQIVRPAGDQYAGTPYFYKENTLYEFYGYYVDDAAIPETDLAKTAGNVSIALEIDGSQDIMAAKADPKYDLVNSDYELSSDLKETDIYSAYAARRSVQPTLTFKHLLTRFQFFVVDGNRGHAEHPVEVTAIEMDSYKEARMQIAPTPMITASGNRTMLSLEGLLKEDGDGMTPATDYTSPSEPGSSKTDYSLMLFAGESSHKIKISLKFADDNNTQAIEPMEFDLNASTIVTSTGVSAGVSRFEAGKQYNIVLIVYGPEEIKISAMLEGWKDGGSSVIDPDEMV